MKKRTPIPRPDRLRAPACSYGWADHRFLRDGHLAVLSVQAIACYLFLILAADRHGISYYRAEVANCRVHGTTRAVPAERLLEERPLLTPPPETAYPTYREEVRTVQRDCTISVGGHLYSVPADLVRCTVSARLHPRHIEVFDARGALRARHAIPDRPGVLAMDPAHYATIKRAPLVSASEMERRFLVAFPGCEAFLDGIKARMKALWHIHAGKIERLVSIYGLDNTRAAIAKAAGYRNFNANAVERVLVRSHPLMALDVESAPRPLLGSPHALSDDGDGSLADYRDVTKADHRIEPPSYPNTQQGEEDDDGTQGQLCPIA